MDIDITAAPASAHDCKRYLDNVLARLQEIASADSSQSPNDEQVTRQMLFGDFVDACLRMYQAQHQAFSARSAFSAPQRSQPIGNLTGFQQRYEPQAAYAGIEAPVRAASLTNKEKEVLERIVEGKTSREVGQLLSISERTVKFHLRNIYSKLNVINRSQAVAMAMRMRMG